MEDKIAIAAAKSIHNLFPECLEKVVLQISQMAVSFDLPMGSPYPN
jgi:hypothetical protein